MVMVTLIICKFPMNVCNYLSRTQLCLEIFMKMWFLSCCSAYKNLSFLLEPSPPILMGMCSNVIGLHSVSAFYWHQLLLLSAFT